jgi:hypothetical protein
LQFSEAFGRGLIFSTSGLPGLADLKVGSKNVPTRAGTFTGEIFLIPPDATFAGLQHYIVLI